MPPHQSCIYQKIEGQEWRNVGKSMTTAEGLLQNQRQAVQTYARDTARGGRPGRTMVFVIAPLEKYPNPLSNDELDTLLDEQPEALNGILK
jgi:hypothetical protein